jgi:hypothetical protein
MMLTDLVGEWMLEERGIASTPQFKSCSYLQVVGVFIIMASPHVTHMSFGLVKIFILTWLNFKCNLFG